MFPLQTHCGGGELQLGLANPLRLHKLLCEWLKRLRNPLDADHVGYQAPLTEEVRATLGEENRDGVRDRAAR